MLLTIPQSRLYQARASLEIQNVNEDFLHLRDISPYGEGTPNFPEVDLQTQVKVLQSRSLTERVIDQLKVENRPLLREEKVHLPDWRRVIGLKPVAAVPVRERLISSVSLDLKVRAQPNTRVIEILYDSTDPVFAADFVNGLTTEFVEQSLTARWNATQHTGEWLVRQMQDLKAKLQKSQDELQRYASSSGLQFTFEKENVAEAKLRQLQTELSNAEADRIVKQSRYELVLSAPAEGVPEVLDDTTLRQYQLTLTDLRRQSAEASSTMTPANPKTLKLQAQIVSLESALERERGNIVRRINNEYNSARRREALLRQDYEQQAQLISQQAAQVAHYDLLKREVDTTRQVYESMLQRVKEAAVASALRASNVRLIDPATPPKLPYKPNRTLHIALGLFGGSLVGLLVAVARDRSERRIEAPGDVRLHIGVPELGTIPACGPKLRDRLLHAGDGRHNNGASTPTLGALIAKVDAPRQEPTGRIEFLTRERTHSIVSECFRNVLTSILLSGRDGDRPRVLALTSAVPGDGKTVVAANLAIALAGTGLRVLLIDGDNRRPRLHTIFGVENSFGLSDFLAPAAGPLPKDLGKQTQISGLLILPSGPACTPELIHSNLLTELISRARAEFDIVLIDTPPMLLIPDARILARAADAVILVVRAGRTTCDAALLACQRLSEDGTNILGTILNGWNPKRVGPFGYGKYYSSYLSYFPKK